MKNIKEALLISIAVVAILLSIGLFTLKEKQKALKEKAAARLETSRGSLNKLNDDFNDKEKLRVQFQNRADELSRETGSLEVQIAQINQIYTDSQQQLAGLDTDINSAEGKIKDTLNEKNHLIDEISSAESAVTKLKERLDILKQTTAALERHLKKMLRITKKEPLAAEKKDIETESQNISPSQAATLTGEVLVVNREFNFIVVNLGKQDGIKEGDTLKIYDGEQLLGITTVETVRDNISAASGGKELDAYRIKPGNKVYANRA